MYILAHSQERKSCTDRIHSHLMLHFPRSLCSSYYVTDDSHLARGTKRQTGSTLRPLLTLVQLAPPLDVSSVIPRIIGYCLSVACLWPQIRIKSLELKSHPPQRCVFLCQVKVTVSTPALMLRLVVPTLRVSLQSPSGNIHACSVSAPALVRKQRFPSKPVL